MSGDILDDERIKTAIRTTLSVTRVQTQARGEVNAIRIDKPDAKRRLWSAVSPRSQV